MLFEKSNREGTIYFENVAGEIVSKQCLKCKEIKCLSEFYRHPRSLGKRKSRCVSCVKEYSQANKEAQKLYREKHKTKQKEYFSNYYKENNEIIRKRSARFYEDNKGNVDFRLKRKEEKRRWIKSKPEAITRNNHLKAARKLGLIAEWSWDDIKDTLSHFEGKCALTGEDTDLHFDHVIPLSSGCAGTVKWNMLPIKAGLNVSKSNRNIFEWFNENHERLGMNKERFTSSVKYLADIKGVSYEEFEDYVNSCFENKYMEEC